MLISAFWATSWQFFSNFFPISRNFTKFYLHSKFQVNWTIQTEIIIEGVGAESALPRPYQSAKSPACLGLKLFQWCKSARNLMSPVVPQLDKWQKFKSIQRDKNDCILYKIHPPPPNAMNPHLSSCGTIVNFKYYSYTVLINLLCRAWPTSNKQPSTWRAKLCQLTIPGI